MLGYESEKRLSGFLRAIGEGERELEIARQRLCTIRDFAPHTAFQRINRDLSDFIKSFELHDFLKDNQVYHIQEPELY